MAKKAGKTKAKAKDETEEERSARLKMEALLAQEQARKQSEQNRVALQMKQAREQRYAHINNIKIHNQWRKIKRMSKVEELKREIEIIAQNHEREVDRKDAILQMLDRDLEDAEEQYTMALRGHHQFVESLQDLQHIRLQKLEEDFNSELNTLQSQFEIEKNETTVNHGKQLKDMGDMISAMEQEFRHAEAEARQEFESQREEVKNRNSEEYNVLKIQLEGTIEELERHFEQAHKVYLDSTEHRTQAFKNLTKNDSASAKVIEKRMKKLMRLQEALAHWRNKIISSTNEWEERNRSLRTEKDMMTRHYRNLKSSMDDFRAIQSQRLKHLSICSENAAAEIKEKLSLANSILKLSETCRKMETEQEKIIPFCSHLNEVWIGGSAAASGKTILSVDSGTSEEHEQNQKINLKESEKQESRDYDKLKDTNEFTSVGLDHNNQEVEEWDYLNNFYKKFNKVYLDMGAIQKEKHRLMNENKDLRAILKQYLDGVSVNAEVMNNPANTLMIVNQRLQLTLAARNKARADRMSQKQLKGQLAVQKVEPT